MAFIKNKILIVKILLSGISILFLATTFHTENRTSGWYQQFLPNLNGRSISDIYFLDSLTGWSVTNATNQVNDTTYVLKTTNGGDNWVIHYRKVQIGGGFPGYFRVYFLNQNTGFTCGVIGIDKTTNGGTNWVSLNAPDNSYPDMSILNEDTIWIVSTNPLTGGVFLTINGGVSWQQQFSGGTENPNKIYMYNARIGFICNNTNNTSLKKTTDGGNNWFAVASNQGFYDLYFSDSLVGWKAGGNVRKTTDGGYNWIQQVLPQGIQGHTMINGFEKLTKYSKDTLWGVGAAVAFPNLQIRAILYRTTNQGTNWLYQLPDTTIHIGNYHQINFKDKNIGWAYALGGGIHTHTGGDTVFYMGIQKISNEIPMNYILHQNYPNPFNPRTVIGYEIKKNSFVKLDVFDILGKEVGVLVNEKQNSGKYEVDYMGKFSPSGIYFYRLMADGKVIDTKKMILVK